MSKPHDRLDERLIDLLYGELDAESAAALQAEVNTDPVLRERLEAWKVVRQAMATLPEPEPDPQVHYEILRAARQAVEAPEKKGLFAWLSTLAFSPAFAALGLAVVGGALWLTLSKGFRDSDAPTAESPLERAANPAPAKPDEPVMKSRGQGVAAQEAPRSTVALEPEAPAPAPEATATVASLAAVMEPVAGVAGGQAAEGGETLKLDGLVQDERKEAAAAKPVELPKAAQAPGGSEGRGEDLTLGLEADTGGDFGAGRRAKTKAAPQKDAVAEAPRSAAPRLANMLDDGEGTFAPPPPDVQGRANRAPDGYVAEKKAEKRSAEVVTSVDQPAAFPAEQPAVAAPVAPAEPPEETVAGGDQAPNRKGGDMEEAKPGTFVAADADKEAEAPDEVQAAEVAKAPVEEAERPQDAPADDDAPNEDARNEDAFGDRMAREMAPPVAQGAGAGPRAEPTARRAADQMKRPAAISERDDRGDNGPPPELVEARTARQRGDHGTAVEAYRRYFAGYSSDDQFGAAMLEAAQSYETLGNLPAALQLYRLASESTDAQVARVARGRIGALESLKKARAADADLPRPAALEDANEAADPNPAPASEPALPE